jgi:hypothetical protein
MFRWKLFHFIIPNKVLLFKWKIVGNSLAYNMDNTIFKQHY